MVVRWPIRWGFDGIGKTVLGTSGLDKLDGRELAMFKSSEREWLTHNVKYFVVLAFGISTFHMFASGFERPAHVFVRVNNWITALLMLLAYVVKVTLQRGPLLASARSLWLEKAIILPLLVHYCLYVSLTWLRVKNLLLYVFSTETKVVEDDLGGAEAYCVLYSVLAICACANFHVLSTMELLFFSVFMPFIWALQCACLGTMLEPVVWLRLMFVYVIFCFLAFLGGRRNSIDHLNNFLRLHMERLQVMRIFREANVPIFIVGQQPGSSELCVELWNTAMEEITQTPVASGTPLSHINCLRSTYTDVLKKAIRRALGQGSERTQRMLAHQNTIKLLCQEHVAFLIRSTGPFTEVELKSLGRSDFLGHKVEQREVPGNVFGDV